MNAGELLNIYSTRLRMQEEGVTDPPTPVKEFTKRLVNSLTQLDESEKVESKMEKRLTTFIRVSTGEILAELEDDET